jgi:hypothetical protein
MLQGPFPWPSLSSHEDQVTNGQLYLKKERIKERPFLFKHLLGMIIPPSIPTLRLQENRSP